MPPRFEIRLPSEQTADAVGIVEITVPAGWDGPPLHHHDGVRPPAGVSTPSSPAAPEMKPWLQRVARSTAPATIRALQAPDLQPIPANTH